MPEPLSGATPTPAPAVIVLDTNAVLDCWLFEDRRAAPLRVAVEQRRVRWQGTPTMLAEIAAVLERPLSPRWNGKRERTLSIPPWRHCELVEAPSGWPHPPGLRCRDRDDQAFVDLALHSGARWLVTRDRDLLALARAATARGVAVVAPQHWVAL